MKHKRSKASRAILLLLSIVCLFPATMRAIIVVLNGLSHENQVQAGEVYRGTIEIQNTGPKAKEVKIYARDYWFSFKGENRHDPAGTLERSNAAWVTFAPELLKLDSAEVATINFEVKVPEDASLKGTYWSVLMVEGVTSPDTSARSGGVQINTAIRYAIQIVTNVGANAKSNLTFLGMELAKEGDENWVYVAMENTGEYILRPQTSLELFDSDGNSVGIFKAEMRKTFPGTSILTTLALEGVKPGNYSGVLIADCGEDRLYGSNLSIDIKE